MALSKQKPKKTDRQTDDRIRPEYNVQKGSHQRYKECAW